MSETQLRSQAAPTFRLAKAVGVPAITASAISAEYGAGIVPKTALIFQPLFQGAVVTAIEVAILAVAGTHAKGRGDSFREIAARLPIE